jgi:hypothetical protein
MFISLLAQRNEPKKGQPDHIGPASAGLSSLFKNSRALRNSLRSDSPRAVFVHFFKVRQSDDGLQNFNFFSITHSFTLSITVVGGKRR